VLSKSSISRWALVAWTLAACQPPAPAVDEERLARRVAELLADRYGEEGLCRARAASGGEEGSDGAEAPAESQEAQQREALDAMRSQMEQLAAAAQRLAPEPALPTVQLAVEQRASSSGTGEHVRVCLPLPAETPAVGPERAIVTIVAFLDPECPFCARLYPLLVRAQQAYAQDVRLAVALHPMSFHQSAPRASMALREAYAQRQSEGFFRYFSRVYSDTRDLSMTTLEGYAEELNIDAARLRDAVSDGRHRDAVAASVALAASANIQGSPTLFVNGRRVLGAVPEDVLGGVLHEEIERARRLQRGTPAARLPAALCRADASSAAPTPARPHPLPASPNGVRP
jgi:protein-disulfide isomerase